jgi:hypothetical protein
VSDENPMFSWSTPVPVLMREMADKQDCNPGV